jgi:hypothetical protein
VGLTGTCSSLGLGQLASYFCAAIKTVADILPVSAEPLLSLQRRLRVRRTPMAQFDVFKMVSFAVFGAQGIAASARSRPPSLLDEVFQPLDTTVLTTVEGPLSSKAAEDFCWATTRHILRGWLVDTVRVAIEPLHTASNASSSLPYRAVPAVTPARAKSTVCCLVSCEPKVPALAFCRRPSD